MLEYLAGIDRVLFLFINVHLANPVTDVIMPVITSDMLLRVIYGAAMVILLWRGSQRLRWLVLFSAVTLLLTDQLSSNLLKNLISRPRPCHLMSGINLLVNCGAGFSMPSSHATNVFGQVTLFSYHVKGARWYLILFASLVALSRIFVGVHYPSDVMVGAALGCLVGLVMSVGFRRFERWRL